MPAQAASGHGSRVPTGDTPARVPMSSPRPAGCPQPQGECRLLCPAHTAQLWGHTRKDVADTASPCPGDAGGYSLGKAGAGRREGATRTAWHRARNGVPTWRWQNVRRILHEQNLSIPATPGCSAVPSPSPNAPAIWGCCSCVAPSPPSPGRSRTKPLPSRSRALPPPALHPACPGCAAAVWRAAGGREQASGAASRSEAVCCFDVKHPEMKCVPRGWVPCSQPAGQPLAAELCQR